MPEEQPVERKSEPPRLDSHPDNIDFSLELKEYAQRRESVTQGKMREVTFQELNKEDEVPVATCEFFHPRTHFRFTDDCFQLQCPSPSQKNSRRSPRTTCKWC